MQDSFDTQELLRLASRRKWFFIVPATLVVAAAVALLLLLPRLYVSEATIVVEQQDVPESIVEPLVRDYIDRRLEILSLHILTTDRLLRIADQYDLYPAQREILSRDGVAALMRERIELETLITQFNDPETGRTGRATMGFKIRFQDPDPERAQFVANELVNAYLAANRDARRARAEQSTTFLSREREALDRRIAAVEEEFTRFKTENRALLPEETDIKRDTLENAERDLRALESELRALAERESFLRTQLALTEEFDEQRTRANGTTPESQLQALRAELAVAEARYRSTHPDLVRLRREVRSLEAVVGGQAAPGAALAEQEAALRAELRSLQERYTDEHPDVVRVQRELAAVRRTLANETTVNGQAVGQTRNPAYVQLSSQLNSVEVQIKSVKERLAELETEGTTLREQLAKAPAVEREYTRYQRELESALATRDALADKERDAKLSGSLEQTAIGERLNLVSPPSRPNSPATPNKKLILALGFVLAMGSGGASALLAELLDRSVRSVQELERILDDTPLAVIPQLAAPAEWRQKRLRSFVLTAMIATAGIGALSWVHYRAVPLDVLGYQTANRIEQWIVRTFPSAAERPPSPEARF